MIVEIIVELLLFVLQLHTDINVRAYLVESVFYDVRDVMRTSMLLNSLHFTTCVYGDDIGGNFHVASSFVVDDIM